MPLGLPIVRNASPTTQASPGSFLEHGDVLLAGNGACGANGSGLVYVLDRSTGRVVHKVKLPTTGVGKMLPTDRECLVKVREFFG